jgi:hypothetical protein
LPTVNPPPGNTVFVSQVQYIQQPDNLTGGVCVGPGLYQGGVFLNATLPNPPDGTETLTFQGVDFIGSAAPGQTDQYEVQPGDFLELFGGGNVHRILNVPSSTTLVVQADPTIPASPPNPQPTPTPAYRILRQPRPALNEDILTLPQDMIIDMGTVQIVSGAPVWGTCTGVSPTTPSPPTLPTPPRSVNVPLRGNYLEILFSPAGGVTGQGTGSGNILLWVRDSQAVLPDLGSPFIVGIQIRTGFIGDYPVIPTDYYAATREARSSGM